MAAGARANGVEVEVEVEVAAASSSWRPRSRSLMELEDIVGDDRPSGSGGAHTSSAMSRFSGYLMTAAVLVIALALLGSVALLAFETHQVADLRAIHADELHVERLVWDGNSTSSSASSSSNDVEAPVEVDVDAPTPTLTPTPTPSDASEPAPSPDPFDIAECSSCGDRDSELLFYTFLDSLQGFKSFVNVYTNVWDLLLFDVPMSMFGKPFLLDASYHFGTRRCRRCVRGCVRAWLCGHDTSG